MIHNTRACLDWARAKLPDEPTASVGGPVGDQSIATTDEEVLAELPGDPTPVLEVDREPQARTGSDQRRQQLKERIGEERRARLCACLSGQCGFTDVDEAPMMCVGRINGAPCPARLHGRKCAQITKGHAALGCFLCPDCRLREARPGEDPEGALPEAREMATIATLIQLSSGAEATGASYFDYKNLEREFMASTGGLVGSTLPSDSASVFITFMCWLVCKKERALSLDTLFRTAGAVMMRTDRPNLTKKSEVKAVYEELRQRHGEETKPRTAVTRRMVRHLLEDVTPQRGGDPLVNARMQLMFAMEVMLGLRVGEALSGGDFHGLLANHFVVLQKLDENGEPVGDETLEAMLEHSKTKHKRWINCVGRSKGWARVEIAKYLRAYWRLAGLKLNVRKEGGYLVTGPDYFVVRLSLVALTGSPAGDVAKLELIQRILARSSCREARKWSDYSFRRAKERLQGDSLEKKYINLAGGHFRCPELGQLLAELDKAGLSDRVELVPGPLMRATHGKDMGMAHMPLQPSSTYKMLHDCFDRAFEMANAETADPELDLRGLSAPLWGHHSARRGADTIARDSMEITGATERDIDIIFGWNEHMYRAVMQLHYESNTQRDRRAKVTSMM